jgi:Tfp pilus assembly protein PilE
MEFTMKLFLLRDLYAVTQLIGILIFLFGLLGGAGSAGDSVVFTILGVAVTLWGHYGYKKDKAKLKLNMGKVPTYIFQNILFTLLSGPPLVSVIMGVILFTSVEIGIVGAIVGTIAFIAAGTILSLTCAREIRRMEVSGQGEEGLKFSKKVNKYFLGVLVMTWVLGLLITVYMPSYTAYRSRGYDAMAKNDLKNFYTASQKYIQKNPDGTIDVELAKQYGFKPIDDVKLEVRGGQQVNFMAIASHPNGTKIFTINNKGEILEQKIPDR